MRASFIATALLCLGAASQTFAWPRKCTVTAKGNGKDDAPALLAAVAKCGKGGTIVLPSKNYTIAQRITTHLEHASLELHGYLSFTPNISYWVANSYRFPFQNQSIGW
jgi:galacturan 1,4-alpha-galacturonidase